MKVVAVYRNPRYFFSYLFELVDGTFMAIMDGEVPYAKYKKEKELWAGKGKRVSYSWIPEKMLVAAGDIGLDFSGILVDFEKIT